jgi:hypothetical protein
MDTYTVRRCVLFPAGVICMGGGVFERQKKEEKEMEKEKFNKEL